MTIGADWLWKLLGLAIAAMVAYYTALGAVEKRVEGIDAREQAHYHELMRRLDELRNDVKDLRMDTNGTRQEILRAIEKRR